MHIMLEVVKNCLRHVFFAFRINPDDDDADVAGISSSSVLFLVKVLQRL